MRLINAHISGYGRLVDVKVNLDAKVLAIVGPNEAGKTTFLNALAFLDRKGQELSPAERSRASTVDGDTKIVQVNFILDDEDRTALEELDLEELPHAASIYRKADGRGPYIELMPTPCKSQKTIEKALTIVKKKVGDDSLLKLVSEQTIYDDPGTDSPRDFRTELQQLSNNIQQVIAESQSLDHESIAAEARTLASVLIEEPKANKLRDSLQMIEEWASRENPGDKARDIIWNRTPAFLLFSENDRTLLSSYNLTDELLNAIPAALNNITDIAKLHLRNLVSSMRSGDIARRDTAIHQANEQLQKIFANAWKQSQLTVKLSIDGSVLRVSVLENDSVVTVFSERSAGLRMFVALVAFLKASNTNIPPILLIDEAENHLHLDAQADLVNMFTSQEEAARIIYTTHSPACLPPDLGTGVRSIVPIKNTQKSEIRNSFWNNGAGYTPLMLAMGAGAAAFTPARCVVLSEGATEMMLLPTLIRKATNLDALPYQVAPGLSEVSKDFYASLDFEGAKVAYLVDGDDGGKELKKALLTAGVPENKVVSLPVPGLENILNPDAYLEAILTLVCEQGIEKDTLSFPKLTEATKSSWAKQLEKWFKDHELKMPSKVAVANRLLESNLAIPSASYVKALLKVHDELVESLGLKDL
jgi:predicted ATP-dependent endonuclease of OLD family